MAMTEARIVIVGCGPGSPDYLTPAARSMAEGADVLIGAGRLLALFPSTGAERIPVGMDTDAVLREIARRRGRGRIVVLTTGDPGLYSLASAVIGRFGREACEVVPGISAVQTAFARLGLPWHDAKIISAHASAPDIPETGLPACAKIAVLGGGAELGPRVLSVLHRAGASDYRIVACEDLTLPEERIAEIGAEDMENRVFSARSVILIVRKDLL